MGLFSSPSLETGQTLGNQEEEEEPTGGPPRSKKIEERSTI